MDPEHGEIRIGFPHSLGIHLIPSVVAAFRQRYPNVKFRFKQGMFPTLIRDVLSAEVDLAFISPFPEKHDQVAGDIVLTEELHAILPPNHPLAGEEEIALNSSKMINLYCSAKGIHCVRSSGMPAWKQDLRRRLLLKVKRRIPSAGW